MCKLMCIDGGTDIRKNKLKKKDPDDPLKIITQGFGLLLFHSWYKEANVMKSKNIEQMNKECPMSKEV